MLRRVHFQEDVDDDGELVELHPLLQWDMAAVIWLAQQKEERQWLRTLVHSTTSSRRTQDISLLIWFVFIIMIPEFGFPYFWICVGNLLAVVTLQYLAQRPRPIDLYHPLWTLQDRRCIDEDTRGFPCVDCHMAVVVLLPAILHTQSVVVQLIFVAIVLYIALCKLLLATRFISQVFGSWLMGFTGILIGNHGQVVVKSYKLTRGYTIAAIVALIVFAMIVLGMWIENNDSSLMGIPKRDFIDVFANILNSDAPNAAVPAQVHQLPGRSNTARARQEESEEVAASAHLRPLHASPWTHAAGLIPCPPKCSYGLARDPELGQPQGQWAWRQGTFAGPKTTCRTPRAALRSVQDWRSQ